MEYVESLGFRLRIAPHALNSAGYVSNAAENRAANLHAMFRDAGARTVAMIGEDHSRRLLPLLDFDLIRDPQDPHGLLGRYRVERGDLGEDRPCHLQTVPRS